MKTKNTRSSLNGEIENNTAKTKKKLLANQEKTLKVKEEMFELKLKAINTQLNPHFVFNALNTIQYFITSGNKKQALKYLSTFSKLIRYNLNYIEKDKVTLKDEVAMLNCYLKLQKLRYNNKFDFTISPEISKIKDAIIPPFIIQTLFENIIEQGAFNGHKNKKLNIKFNISKTKITLNISYSYDIETKNNSYTPEYRKGIIAWQDQIKLLNQVSQYNIKKEISFLKNKNNQEGNIILQLPNLI